MKIDKLYVASAVALVAFFASTASWSQNINGCAGGNCTTGDQNTYFPGANTGQYSGPGAGATNPNFFTPVNAPTNTNAQGQTQGQGQLQGQAQGQGQSQGQSAVAGAISGAAAISQGSKASSSTGASTSGAMSGGNTLTVNEAPIPAQTGQDIRYSGIPNNTPSIGLGGLYPSAPCMGTSNIGGSVPGFGLGIGSSWTDKNCQIMETARNAPTTEDRTSVWCLSDFAKEAPSCKKAAAAAAKTSAVDAPTSNQPDRRRASSTTNGLSPAGFTFDSVGKL